MAGAFSSAFSNAFDSAAAAFTLTAGTGVFTETGNAANLLHGYTLTAAAGAFTETGNDADLRATRLLTAGAGSFVLTGNQATLTYSAAGVTFVQSASQGFGASASPRTLAWPSNVTAGNFLVVVVGTFNVATLTLTDTLGNTYQEANSYAGSGGTNRLSIWYVPQTAGGANTVTVTPSITAFMAIAVLEYSGFTGLPVLDSTSIAGTTSSSTPSTGTVGVSGAGELVIGAYTQGDTILSSSTVASPFTNRETVLNGASTQGLGVADDTNASAAEGAVFTVNTSVSWAAIGASFKNLVIAPIYAPEISTGPPMRGAPWASRLRFSASAIGSQSMAPAPPRQIYAPEITFGPLFGAPWHQGAPGVGRGMPQEGLTLPNIPAPQVPAFQIQLPEFYHGPPIPGSPWMQGGPTAPGSPGPFPPPPTPPPPVPPGRIVGHNLPFIVRDPTMEPRTRRATEKLQDSFNALLGHGMLVQVGPNDFVIRGAGGFRGVGPPTVMFDETVSFQPGSIYVDINTNAVWVCKNAAEGAAVWAQIA